MKNAIINLFFAMFLGMAMSLAASLDGGYLNPLVPITTIIALQIVRFLVGSELPKGILANAADITALTTYAGKHPKELIATMLNKMDFLKDVVVIPNVKNKIHIGKLDVGAGVRPFSSNEEFQDGDLKYTDRSLEVEAFKREIRIDPEAYRTSWLSEALSAGSNSKKYEIPFEKFTWAQIMKAMWAEINNNCAYDGFDRSLAVAYDNAATYTVDDYITHIPSGTTVVQWYKCLVNTAAGESPDTAAPKWNKVTASALFKGYGTRIEEEIANTNLTPTVIGAIDATSGVARGAFLELFREMPVVYQKAGAIINCSFDDYNFLMDDIENITKYTRHDSSLGPGQSPDFMFLPKTNNKCIIKPCTWITGRRLICGPTKEIGGNWVNQALLFGTDLDSDIHKVNVLTSELWKYKAGIKALGGTQIANLDEIVINDQQ